MPPINLLSCVEASRISWVRRRMTSSAFSACLISMSSPMKSSFCCKVCNNPANCTRAPSSGGRLVSPGFVETHNPLDKSCILDRVKSDKGDLDEAIGEAAKAKRAFTPEDVHARGTRTLEKAILQGTTHMRTHVEVDPGVGLRGLEGVLPLIKQYAWAIDLQICVFPQEGLLNNPGTDELMVESLKRGCRTVGGAPYVDSNPSGQIDRIFELAREYDIDIDIHLDFGPTADGMDLEHVCRRTEEFQYGGRVAIGHVTKAASLPMP